ncbi:MAG: AMP-binding protein [Lachnospiraceae bacterium]
MLYNILEFLEHSAALHPHKTAVVDEYKSCNYEELLDYSCRIGSALSYRIEKSSPIIVYMEKGVDTICSFFGIL